MKVRNKYLKMTVKSSLLKIKKYLIDEEILVLHFEGCPHAYANSENMNC